MSNTADVRAAVTRAASALFEYRRPAGECDFGKSHRDGPCATCVARDLHDAELARQAREGQA